ncbi:MAG: azurin [Gammaproteobacteria bacterium]|nr:MAG: azurin [Gammaproteobacteria bacterium]
MKKYLAIFAVALLGNQVSADECSVDITGNDQMKYNVSEITVPKRCAEFTINLANIGKLPRAAMGHNVVIAKAADKIVITTDGIAAGLDNDYIKPDDARVVAHSKVVGGGETTSVKFKPADLKDGEDYEFFCSFPGHVSLMWGKLLVK